MILNKEKTLASLQISGDLNAAQLDALLRQLALLRSDMTPAVPGKLSELEQTDTAVLVEDKPALIIAARRGGGYRLWLRHRGFGWLAYQVDERTAVGMGDFIRARTKDHGVNLIEHDEPKRH